MAQSRVVTSRPSGSSRSWARTGGKDELTHRLPLRFASTQSGAIRMAEQKIDDTKIAAARRGARPFAGPTGAATSPRPFSRPAAPAARPANGPFAPPSAGRPALGANAPPFRPAETLVAEAASAPEQPAVPHPVIVASTATSAGAHAEGITSALEAAIVEV